MFWKATLQEELNGGVLMESTVEIIELFPRGDKHGTGEADVFLMLARSHFDGLCYKVGNMLKNNLEDLLCKIVGSLAENLNRKIARKIE